MPKSTLIIRSHPGHRDGPFFGFWDRPFLREVWPPGSWRREVSQGGTTNDKSLGFLGVRHFSTNMQRKHPMVPQVHCAAWHFLGSLGGLDTQKKSSKLCAMIQWPGFPWISQAYDGIIPEIWQWKIILYPFGHMKCLGWVKTSNKF